MRKILTPILFAAIIFGFGSCQKMANNSLKRQMKKMAVKHLEQDNITDYDDLTIECVDTVTEFAYASLTSELLTNMESFYEQQYEAALLEDSDQNANTLRLYLNEITRVRDDINDLMINGDIKSKGLFLYMVTGKYQKNKKGQEFMFLVLPDKKTLHTIDPFGNNLLYQDEE